MQRVFPRRTRNVMPTPARGVAALGMMATGFFTVSIMLPWLSAGAETAGLLPAVLVIAVLIGWRVVGTATGQGYGFSLKSGLRGAIYLGLFLLFYLGLLQMLVRATRRLYHGPFDALTDIFGQAIAIGGAVLHPDVIAVLFLGGAASAILSEWVGQRWS